MTKPERKASVRRLRLVNLEAVPTVDISGYSPCYRSRYKMYSKAINKVAKGKSPKVAAGTAMSERSLRTQIERFMDFDPRDGQLVGYRALAPFYRTVEYVRTAPLSKGTGSAGRFMQVLRGHTVKDTTGLNEKSIENWLIDFLNGSGEGGKFRPNQVLWQPLTTVTVVPDRSSCFSAGHTSGYAQLSASTKCFRRAGFLS